MNRRTFFKRVAATCAVAVVAPVALAKAKRPGIDKMPPVIGSCDDKIRGMIEDLPHVSFENPYVDAPYGMPSWIAKLDHETKN